MPRKRKIATSNENAAPQNPGKVVEHPNRLSPDEINVMKIIINSQKTDTNHKKGFAELEKLYGKMDHDLFMDAMFKVLFAVMHLDETEENKRVLRFVSTFVGNQIENETNPEIVISTFDEILGVTSTLPLIRLKICQFVMMTMNSLSAKAELDDSIIESITFVMLQFMKDISPLVRVQAVYALQRLQDPDDQDDPVVHAYKYNLEHDPSPKVRQAVLTSIGKKLTVIPAILDRLHDVDEKVRRHVYIQMSSYPVKTYKISHRIQILENGLYDRSDMVRKAVINIMLPNWIEAYDKNYVNFIAAIKIDAKDEEILRFRKISSLALSELFKKHSIDDIVASLNFKEENEFKNCIPYSKISLESLTVWKEIVSYHQSYQEKVLGNNISEDWDADDSQINDGSIVNEDLLPELSVFCAFMDKFVNEADYKGDKFEELHFNYAILILLDIVKLYDFGDEIGRENLKKLLQKILIEHNVSESVIHTIVEIFENLMTDAEVRVDFLVSIAKNIVDVNSANYTVPSVVDDIFHETTDMDLKLKITNLKLKILELKESENSLVEKKQYSDAQKVIEEAALASDSLTALIQPYLGQVNSCTPSSINSLMDAMKPKKLTTTEILKCLQICYHMIVSQDVQSLTQSVLALFKNFVRLHLEAPEIQVRSWALKTSTAYSMLYDGISQETFGALKTQLFRNVSVPLWAISIECIFELLDRYGFDHFENTEADKSQLNSTADKSKKAGRKLIYTSNMEEDEEKDQQQMVDNIETMGMMNHIMESCLDPKISKVIITGYCRIILHGHYKSRDIISKFLLSYFNPATEPEINQLLGVFFKNLIHKKRQECLQEALVPTLITLLDAPYDSPLQEIKMDDIVQYVIESTRPIYCSSGLNIHNQLAIMFFQLMTENLKNKYVLQIFSKELLVLEVSDDPTLKTDLKACADKLIEHPNLDPKTIKNVVAFKEMLQGTYKTPLTFSSTATSAIIKATSDSTDLLDPDEMEESDNEDTPNTNECAVERIQQTDCLDISISKVKLRNFHVNVSNCIKKKNLENIVEDSDTDNSLVENDREHVEIPSTQVDFVDIPQAITTTEGTASKQSPSTPVLIPTSDEDSEDECSKTVIENQSIKSLIEDTIPASPNADTTRHGRVSSRLAATHTLKTTAPVDLKRSRRQLTSSSGPSSPSVSSPLRKLPKRVETNKTPTRAAGGKTKLTVTPSRSVANTLQRTLAASLTPISPIRKKIPTDVKTSTPVSASSTVSRTRSQAKEEFKKEHVMTRRSINALDASTSSSRSEKTKSRMLSPISIKAIKLKEPVVVAKSSSVRSTKKPTETDEKKTQLGRSTRQRQ